MHARRAVPEKEWLSAFHGFVHEVERDLEQVFFNRLHTLASERTGVFALLFPPRPETRIGRCRVIRCQSNATEYPAGSELLVKGGILRVVRIFRLFLGVEVIKVSVKFIEAVDGWQKFVSVAEVVLANLSGGVSERLEQFGDCWVFLLQSKRRTRQPDGQQARTKRMLPRNKRGTPRRAALLSIVIGEEPPFIGYAVDVGRAPPHHSVMVGTNIPNADIIGHNHKNVR